MTIEANAIVKIQGDEALVDPKHIDASVESLINSEAEASILLTQFREKQSYSNSRR